MEKSVYVFLLSTDVYSWAIAITCIVFQMMVLFLFLNAANIQKKGNDWEYTLLCPAYTLECLVVKQTTLRGWILFLVVVTGWVLKDLLSWFRLFMNAMRMRSFDYFFVSALLTGVSFLTIYVSMFYNKAIATTDTELIVNAVILLFVTDLDEQIFEVVIAVSPSWAEMIISETKHIAQNRNGKGMLSKLRHYALGHNLNDYNFPVETDIIVEQMPCPLDGDDENNPSKL